MRVEDSGAVSAETTTGFCFDCKKPVWISPSSVAMLMERPQTVTRCNECMHDRLRAQGLSEFKARVLPEAIEEFKQFLKDN